MGDKPILFSAPMVCALLDGRKTQTRRIFVPPPPFDIGDDIEVQIAAGSFEPYRFQKGNRLWVRETWRTGKSLDAVSPKKIATMCQMAGWRRPWCPLLYTADGTTDNADTDVLDAFGCDFGRTRVSIHMPRWASRLTLTVTDVRVQRLNQMTEADAIAEGVECYEKTDAPLVTFAKLWNAINKDERHSWQNNPWVCAVTFRPELNSAKCQG